MLSRNHLCIASINVCAMLHANNIQVSNVQLVGQNTTNHTYQVQFDLSWENSWRTSTLESNWDAAWVFIKCSKLDFNDWKHARLNLAGSAAPSGATVQVVDNSDNPAVGVGAFIYRSADGIGNITFTGVQLQWDYSAAGYTDNDLMEVCVQAIEMVYVPQGPFYLGDGAGSTMAGFESAASGTPFQVVNDNTAITLGGSGPGSLGNNDRSGQHPGGLDDFTDGVTKTLPASYPMGYDAFYCMKYEISQGQYAEFLSKLTSSTAPLHYPGITGYGHTILLNGTRYESSAPERACNYLTWANYAAYLDWAALRPISATEFEKVCRGTRQAVPGEYAWGNAGITATKYGNEQTGTATEHIGNLPVGIGNAWYANTCYSVTYGPLRCGIFSASASEQSREVTGASYYGAMELSGNLTEYCITVGNPQGRAFTGGHGNGALGGSGQADVSGWPSSGTGIGTGYVGGAWSYEDYKLRVSNRAYVNLGTVQQSSDLGGRGVRTAP